MPCILTFRGPAKNVDLDKVKKLLHHTLQVSNTIEKGNQPPTKKFKAGSINCDFDTLLTGEKLSDIPIKLVQILLNKQFLSVNGLCSTLLQSKLRTGEPLNNQLQIIHSHRDHLILPSTVGCTKLSHTDYNVIIFCTNIRLGIKLLSDVKTLV